MNTVSKREENIIGAKLAAQLKLIELSHPIRLMEVCGTHTHSLFRSGVRDLLPPSIKLISGPGCPVCVTPPGYIDMALELAKSKDIIITTFGDMMRVPGKKQALQDVKAEGADIRIIYSPLDSLVIARENPSKKVVFLAVGFETTIPSIASSILRAVEMHLTNLTFLTAHKSMPNALRTLISDPEVSLDGFILPGHVSAITGSNYFKFLSDEYKIPAVITGFQPVEMLAAILKISPLAAEKKPALPNLYSRLVTPKGNIKAQEIMNQVFATVDSTWRGIGKIPNSGMELKPKYADYDAKLVYQMQENESAGPEACCCGEILKGKITPYQCPLFKTVCTPEKPVGPCMVSSEGTCAAYYKYSN